MIQDVGWIGGQHRVTAPISNDLRERVVEAIQAGESCRSVAARFGVAVSSTVKRSQRYRLSDSHVFGTHADALPPLMQTLLKP
jgi:hypothetical protein